MYKYEIIIYWREDDVAYISEVPELPGYQADVFSYQEVLSNTESVITEWIETAKLIGRDIPEPKGRLKYA